MRESDKNLNAGKVDDEAAVAAHRSLDGALEQRGQNVRGVGVGQYQYVAILRVAGFSAAQGE